jgi:hypothetical protein
MFMTELFAIIGLLTLLGLTIFQTALILGAPIGNYAWGGQKKQLPTRLRVASATSIFRYLLFATFLASKAGMLSVISDNRVLGIWMWVFTAYFFLGIVMNAISLSKPERNLMTPVAAILAVSFLVVAIN